MTDEVPEKPDHPTPNRSAVPVPLKQGSLELHYVILSDEAAQAMVAMAETATSTEQNYSAQRQQVTAINIAFVGAILGYNFYPGTDAHQSATFVSIVLLFLIAATFWSFIRQIGAAEVYFHTSRAGYTNLIQRHFKIRSVHWLANTHYNRDMSFLKPLLDRHLHQISGLINLLTPIGAALALWWAK